MKQKPVPQKINRSQAKPTDHAAQGDKVAEDNALDGLDLLSRYADQLSPANRHAIELDTRLVPSGAISAVAFLRAIQSRTNNLPALARIAIELDEAEDSASDIRVEGLYVDAVLTELAGSELLSGLIHIIGTEALSETEISTCYHINYDEGKWEFGRKSNIMAATTYLERLAGIAIGKHRNIEIIYTDAKQSISKFLNPYRIGAPSEGDFAPFEAPTSSENFDKNVKISNRKTVASNAPNQIGTKPSLTPRDFEAFLDGEDCLDAETRQQLAGVFAWLVNDAAEQKRQSEASRSTAKKPQYTSKRSQSDDNGMKQARWLVDHWSHEITYGLISQQDLHNLNTGDRKLLLSIRGAVIRKGLLENPDFAELMIPLGKFPPYRSFSDIIPTGPEANRIRQIRNSIMDIGALISLAIQNE